MKRYIRKALKKIATLALAMFTLFGIIAPTLFAASAESEVLTKFDESPVMDDLADVDLSEFTEGVSTDVQLVRFTEYGYSKESSTNYGLYLYVYNPQGLEFSEREGANEINIAVDYDDKGNPTSYQNLTLKICGYASGIFYTRRYYKFRVVENVSLIYNNAKRLERETGSRRYDIAGVQLWEKGTTSAQEKTNLSAMRDFGDVNDYDVSKTFYFSGYAKGYGKGAEEESTLTCSYVELDTIKLDLQHTNYRLSTPYKSGDENSYHIYEEVNSVYFSIPNQILDELGALTSIKAEWYEYKTTPIFVTSDQEAFDALKTYAGINIGEYKMDLPWRVLWEDTISYAPGSPSLPAQHSIAKSYNFLNEGSTVLTSAHFGMFFYEENYLPRFDWLFYKDADTLDEYKVSRSEVEAWALYYTRKNRLQQAIPGAGTLYAEGLFDESIDEDRIQFLEDSTAKRGYICQDISADQKVDLLQYKDQSRWEKWLGKRKTTEVATSYEAIKLLTIEDLDESKASAKEICDNLFINIDDYDQADGSNNKVSFKDYCLTAFEDDETPVLFRFANTDYYASEARFDKAFDENTMSPVDGYVAQQTCFLDFDIISLTFEKEGTVTVLACVTDPIDIFNGVTPPHNLTIGKVGCQGFDIKKMIAIVIIAFGAVIVIKILAWFRDKKTLRDSRKEMKKNKRNKR